MSERMSAVQMTVPSMSPQKVGYCGDSSFGNCPFGMFRKLLILSVLAAIFISANCDWRSQRPNRRRSAQRVFTAEDRRSFGGSRSRRPSTVFGPPQPDPVFPSEPSPFPPSPSSSAETPNPDIQSPRKEEPNNQTDEDSAEDSEEYQDNYVQQTKAEVQIEEKFQRDREDEAIKHRVYGDVLMTPKTLISRKLYTHTTMRAVARESGGNRWSGNVVPVKISGSYSSHERHVIQRALKELEGKTCFRFPERRGEHSYVYIDKRGGCYSYVGRIGGRQLVSLGNGCVLQNTVQHEIMHALGFQHEHQRYDRDHHIVIMRDNVEHGQMGNFDLIPRHLTNTFGQSYDVNSVMHYDEKAFGKMRHGRRLPTMKAKNGTPLRDNRLGGNDVRRLNMLGKCGGGGGGSSSRGGGRGGRHRHRRHRKHHRMPDIAGSPVNNGCINHSPDCHSYEKQGYCDEPKFVDAMTTLCPAACGKCPQTETPEEIKPEITAQFKDDGIRPENQQTV